MYFMASSMMLLVNKFVMTYLPAPALVTTLQYLTSAVVVFGLAKAKAIECETEFTLGTIRKYIFIPVLFSGAIFSNSKMLEYANVETFLVFRFSTPILVAVVDFALMGKALPIPQTWASFLLIVFGAVLYAVTDLGFSVATYSWAVVYLATITTEMIVVKHIFSTLHMSNWTRVLLNNALSIPFQPIFFYATREHERVQDLEFTPAAVVMLTVSCFLGLVLAFAGTTLRAGISATTFTVVGVVCKVLTELLNIFLWDKHANAVGLLALAICLAGSLLFVPSKQRSADTGISNRVWDALNLCGCLKACELESPSFKEGADPHHAKPAAVVYSAVPVNDSDHGHDGHADDDLKKDDDAKLAKA